MASGKAFSDVNSPAPLFRVGNTGETGAVEMSDLVLTSKGPCPGAILTEWNLGASSQGSNGIWDVHYRIGGFAGTELQSDTCSKNPNVTTTAETVKKCTGIFLALHVTVKGSLYAENTWMWTSDHELDQKDHNQINIFSGRGILIESTEPNVSKCPSFFHPLGNKCLRPSSNIAMLTQKSASGCTAQVPSTSSFTTTNFPMPRTSTPGSYKQRRPTCNLIPLSSTAASNQMQNSTIPNSPARRKHGACASRIVPTFTSMVQACTLSSIIGRWSAIRRRVAKTTVSFQSLSFPSLRLKIEMLTSNPTSGRYLLL